MAPDSPSPAFQAPRFRIAISGAGPAGLTLAATIARFSNPNAPVAVDLYEASPEISTIGAGIAVWPRTSSILKGLGLMGSLQGEIGSSDELKSAGWMFRKGDQAEGFDLHLLEVVGDPLRVHRSVLLDALQSGLPPAPLCTIHTSARLVSYSPSDASAAHPLTLHFADGSTATADALVGADGIRSTVRRVLMSDEPSALSVRMPVKPRWTGTIAYRSLIRRERLEQVKKGHQAGNMEIIYCGKDKHVVAYPIAKGTFINFVAFNTVPGGEGTEFKGKWVQDASVNEIRERYVGWEHDVQALIQCVETATAWAIHDVPGLPKYVKGRAAIIGDAAHAMETHFGAGAGQAMEDAYILGRLLTHSLTTESRLEAALMAYERIRLPFTQNVLARGRKVRDLYELVGISTGPSEDAVLGTKPPREHKPAAGWVTGWADSIRREWRWQWERGPEKIWADADGMLEEVLHREVRSHL